MISISPDVRKIKRDAFQQLSRRWQHLKQTKKKVFNSPFREKGFWHEEWGENEKKKTGSRKSVKRKWRLWLLQFNDGVGGAGRLLVSLSTVTVNLVVYLG